MANRLANATSPYLLQHANNPVDWHEWGPEALSLAHERDKPLLVSIGYAACHWCHVMERESFEDEQTAALMNDKFVCIKVDREERPDLDAVYMDAVQAMTGHGGWPMTMFCAPDGMPLYGGTYYPPEDRHGLPSFRRVLGAVAAAWETQREALLEQGGKLVESIGRLGALRPGTDPLDSSIAEEALGRLASGFDAEWGGFGRAPKFPQPMILEFLLRAVRMGLRGADEMLATTLDRMRRGGMYDQVGGGFARYSVDAFWHVPHFEKMLYDNGQLMRLYARAALVAASGRGGALERHEEMLRTTAIETGEYLLREMRHARGGFFSSQDADSEGVEGKFAVWSLAELRQVAGDDADAATHLFAVSEAGNWEGTNVLWIPRDHAEVAASLGIGEEALRAAAGRALSRLFERRRTRVQPGIDDKVLASWNGLAISAFAETGRAFGREDFVDAARDALSFVLDDLVVNGRLMRSWRDGRTSGPGYLDDYALVAGACLDVYETVFDESLFTQARDLAERMIALFADPNGGFFDTGSDAETLVVRPKDLFDNAVPSGNSAAATMLLRLWALTGEDSYRDHAERTLRLTSAVAKQSPLGFGLALCAIDDVAAGIKEVAIAGEDPSALARVVWSRAALPRVVAAGDPASTTVPLLEQREARDGSPTAYVCERFACKQPVTDPQELAAQLDA